MEKPMPQPKSRLASALGHLGGGANQQRFERFQRQPGAGLAVARTGEVLTHQPRHEVAGDIAVEDLQQEQADGCHRVQLAVAPDMSRLAHGLPNRFVFQFSTPTLLELPQDLGDTGSHLSGLRGK
jgi:hypothetical protein